MRKKYIVAFVILAYGFGIITSALFLNFYNDNRTLAKPDNSEQEEEYVPNVDVDVEIKSFQIRKSLDNPENTFIQLEIDNKKIEDKSGEIYLNFYEDDDSLLFEYTCDLDLSEENITIKDTLGLDYSYIKKYEVVINNKKETINPEIIDNSEINETETNEDESL